MDNDQTQTNEAGDVAEQEPAGPSNLERFSAIGDDEIASALELATTSSAEREAAAMADPEPEPEATLSREELAAVWEQELEDDLELAGSEEQIREVLSVYPDLAQARTEEEARANLDLIRHHVRAADEAVELRDLQAQKLVEEANEALIYVEDDVQALQLLEHLSGRLDPSSPEFAEVMEQAEAFAPAAAVAFQSMLEQVQIAELADRDTAAAEEAELKAQAIFAAIQEAVDESKAQLSNDAIRDNALEIAATLGDPPSTPEEAKARMRAIVAGATEVDRVTRTSQFLAEFDRLTAGRVPMDADREAIEAEAAAMIPETDTSVLDVKSSRERVDAFGDAFDAYFARHRQGYEESQQAAARAEKRAREAT